jgi:catechol 2,3-dioxygenase-like lactoylglutathione lyase family enzyme
MRECDHIGLFTNDADRLIRFYQQALGFEVEKDEIVPAAVMRPIFGIADACRLVKLTPSDKVVHAAVKLEIFQLSRLKVSRRKNAAAGYNHWGLKVRRRAALLRRFRRLHVPLIEVPRSSHFIYFIRDPDGNRIEIRE